jgi:hypothetical protein
LKRMKLVAMRPGSYASAHHSMQGSVFHLL